MATEDDKINTGALATLVVVGVFATLAVALGVDALVRYESGKMQADRAGHAETEVRDLVKEQRAQLAAQPLPIERAMAAVVLDLRQNPWSATPPQPEKDAGADAADAAPEEAADAGADAAADAGATDADGGAPAPEGAKAPSAAPAPAPSAQAPTAPEPKPTTAPKPSAPVVPVTAPTPVKTPAPAPTAAAPKPSTPAAPAAPAPAPAPTP